MDFSEMDFHSMKRKELQALCKKHEIAANLTNVEMINKLSSIFKGKEEVRVARGRSCLKRVEDESVSENVVDRKAKKVRFSPENDMFEFVRSNVMENRRGGRRRSVLSKVSFADEIVENVISTGRVTRSRVKELVEGGEVETKRARKCTESNVDLVDVSKRTLRNTGKMREEKLVNVGVDSGKRGGKDNVDKGDGKGDKVVMEIDKVVESQRVLRRSKRKGKEAEEESSMLSVYVNENEVVGKRMSRRTKKVVMNEACELEAESKIDDEADAQGMHEPVQVKKPENVGLKRSNRRKSVIPSQTENGKAVVEKEKILQLEEAPKAPSRRSYRQKSTEIADDRVGNNARNGKKSAELVIRVVSRKDKKISLEKTGNGNSVEEKGNILQPEKASKVPLRRSNRQRSAEIALESVGNDAREDKISQRNSRRSEPKVVSIESATMTNETLGNKNFQTEVKESSRRTEGFQMQDNLRRLNRNAPRDEHPKTEEKKDGNLNAAHKREPNKQTRKHTVEEEAVEITGNEAAVSADTPKLPLKQRVRHDKPVALNNPFTRGKKQCFLVKGSTSKCHEERARDGDARFQNLAERAANAAPSNTEVVMDNFGESSGNNHLNHTESLMESSNGDSETSGEKSPQETHDGTGAGTCDEEEAKGLECANLDEGSLTMSMDVSTHHTNVEISATKVDTYTENVTISLEINLKKSPENCKLNDVEEKEEDCNHMVELKCVSQSDTPKGADSAEATFAINSHSVMDNSDSMPKFLGGETVHEPSARKDTQLAVDDVDEDDKVSAHNESLLEQESTQKLSPPVLDDYIIKDLGDDNENDAEKDEDEGDCEAAADNTTENLEDDNKNGFQEDEKIGDQGHDEKDCGTAAYNSIKDLGDDDEIDFDNFEEIGDHVENQSDFGPADGTIKDLQDDVEIDFEIGEENGDQDENERDWEAAPNSTIKELGENNEFGLEKDEEIGDRDENERDCVASVNNTIQDLGDDSENSFQKDEGTGDQDEKERDCGAALDNYNKDCGDDTVDGFEDDEEAGDQYENGRNCGPAADSTFKDLGDAIENGFEKDDETDDQDEDEQFWDPAAGSAIMDLGDDNKNGFENEEEDGVQDKDEKEYGAANRVNEVKEIFDSLLSHHVDEAPLDSSCHSKGTGEKSVSEFCDNREAGVIAFPERETVTLENPEEAKAEVISETIASELHQSDHNDYAVELSNSEDFEILLERRDQCGQRDDTEADKITQDDELTDYKEQNVAQVVVHDKDMNDSEFSVEAADKQRNLLVSPDVVAKCSQGKLSESKLSSSSFSSKHLSSAKTNLVEHQGLEIWIGSEETQEVHSIGVEVVQIEETPATLQNDDPEGSNSSMEVDNILGDLDGQQVTQTLGSKHNIVSMDTPEARGVVDDAFPFTHSPLKDSSHEEQGEKGSFTGNSEMTIKKFAKDKTINRGEDAESFESTEAFNEDVQGGEQLRNLFATPLSVIKTTQEKEWFGSDNEKAGEAFDSELLNAGSPLPNNNKCWQEKVAGNLVSTLMNNENDYRGAEMTDPPVSLEEAKVSSGDLEKGSENKQCLGEKTMISTPHQVLNASPSVAWPEDHLRLLFATPVQSITRCNDSETSASQVKMAEDASYANDQDGPQDLMGELECGSEKVIETSPTSVSDDGNIVIEEFDGAKGDLTVNLNTFSISSEDVSLTYEVSEEQMVTDFETTAANATGIEFVKGDKNEDVILSSSTMSPDKEATDHSRCIETTPVTTANDLIKTGQSRGDISHANVLDTLREGNDAVPLMEFFDKSEARCSMEMDCTIGFQETYVIALPPDETKADQDDPLEAEVTVEGEQPNFYSTVAEVEADAKEEGVNAVVSADEASCTFGHSGNVASLLRNPFHEDNDVNMESNTKASSDMDVDGANAECKIEEAQCRDDFVGLFSSHEVDAQISDDGTPQEKIQACSFPQDVHGTTPLAEDELAPFHTECELLSQFETNAIPAENEESEEGKESSNHMLIPDELVSSDHQQTRGKDGDSSSNISDVLDQKVLEESEVAAAIKEYIDSEPKENISLSVNSSGVKNHINSAEMNVAEHIRIDMESSMDADEIDKPSIEQEQDESNDTMKKREASSVLAPSRGFIAEESSMAEKVDAVEELGKRLFTMQRNSSVKTRNVRSILIHGTPMKVDMKENAPATKGGDQIGSLTTVRPAKRRALEDLSRK